MPARLPATHSAKFSHQGSAGSPAGRLDSNCRAGGLPAAHNATFQRQGSAGSLAGMPALQTLGDMAEDFPQRKHLKRIPVWLPADQVVTYFLTACTANTRDVFHQGQCNQNCSVITSAYS